MKVVFLDIDGVLNSGEFSSAIDEHHRTACNRDPYILDIDGSLSGGGCLCYRQENQIDPLLVERLNRLVTTSGAKVVISSSWRCFVAADEIARTMRMHGFTGEVIGETPDGPNHPDFIDMSAHEIDRGHEIAHWLADHREKLGVDGFVILDDCSDMAHLATKLVLTDPCVGLTDADVEAALLLLV